MTIEQIKAEIERLINKSGEAEADGFFLALVRQNGTRQFLTSVYTREAARAVEKMQMQTAKRGWQWWKSWLRRCLLPRQSTQG